MAEIAFKHDVDPHRLLTAVIDAWTHRQTMCGPLQITCRTGHPDDDPAMFLVTTEDQVVSQFPINTTLLRHPQEAHTHLHQLPLHEIRARYQQADQRVHHKIGNLHHKMQHVDLTAQIIEIPPMQRVMTRFGHHAHLTNVKIADDTGSIHLSLWNTQIHNHAVGDRVAIINGHVAQYQGELQLRLGRHGTIQGDNTIPLGPGSPHGDDPIDVQTQVEPTSELYSPRIPTLDCNESDVLSDVP
jgi:hypothetical protein